MEPGRELDEFIGKAMNFKPRRIAIATSDGGKSCAASEGDFFSELDIKKWVAKTPGYEVGYWEFYPHYSTDLEAAWDVVIKVQKDNPGWRFSLLGGDTCFGYLNNSPIAGVDPSNKKFFGWDAQFFGHEDPRKCTGQRHGTAREVSAPHAICKAVLEAIGSKKQS